MSMFSPTLVSPSCPSPLTPTEQVHHAHALLLILGSPAYLTSKMSSTVVSSLTAGVPIIADEAVLKAYSFLNHDEVFLMRPGEDEVDAMMRVSRGKGGREHRGVVVGALGWVGTKQREYQEMPVGASTDTGTQQQWEFISGNQGCNDRVQNSRHAPSEPPDLAVHPPASATPSAHTP